MRGPLREDYPARAGVKPGGPRGRGGGEHGYYRLSLTRVDGLPCAVMTFVYNLMVTAHLLGMAAVVGGYVASQPRVSELMVWGARVQILTGVILLGMAESIHSLGKDPNMAKMITKLVVAVLVAAFAEMGRADAKRGKEVAWMTHAAGGLAILNVFIAALWK